MQFKGVINIYNVPTGYSFEECITSGDVNMVGDEYSKMN